MIQDALLKHSATFVSPSSNASASASGSPENAFVPPPAEAAPERLRAELLLAVICSLHTADASRQFGDVGTALDFLSLPLYETELAASYAPKVGCLDATLTISMTLWERSPFSPQFAKRGQAGEGQNVFSWENSVVFTPVRGVNAWH